MATWQDFKPIFSGQAACQGWTADDRDFTDALDIGDDFRPARESVFRALEEISPDQVRFLILGLDPYADRDPTGITYATGIAFAIDERCTKPPRSLGRIMRSIYPDGHGRKDLGDWRRVNGILLLNAALTVPALSAGENAQDVSGRHLSFWRKFTARLIVQVQRANPEVRLIAWGDKARGVICDALELSGAFASAYHPTTYGGGDKSFEKFWETPIGLELRRR